VLEDVIGGNEAAPMSNSIISSSIIRFGENAPAAETGRPGNIVSGTPETRVHNYYTDASGQFFAGIWESTIGKWRIHYTEEEFCTLLEGKAVLTDEDGRSRSFVKGDAFVIPSGFSGTWETVEPVKKYYAIFEAKK
jgi:uncharacterized cupin superfamily protein